MYVVCLPVFVCIAAFLPFLLGEKPSSTHLQNNALQGNTDTHGRAAAAFAWEQAPIECGDRVRLGFRFLSSSKLL